jgi:mono/diheme cytochrome c family protein
MRVAACMLAIALAGCLDPLEPELGPPVHARCVGEDSDPATDVSFDQQIRRGIFEAECVACHTPGGDSPIGLEVGGLDLSSYASVRAGGAITGDQAIIPGDPCASLLVQKLGEAPPFGGRMPLDGPPFLSATAQQTIIDWIAEGAADN